MRIGKQTIVTARLIALLAVLWTASAAWAEVSVKVFESTTGSVTTYFYRLQNGTSQPIVGLRIGFDSVAGESQLSTVPLGWTIEGGLPASSATAPAGWEARVVTTEESAFVDLDWSSEGGADFDIAPGATVTGFSVKVAQPAAEYRTSSFVATLGNSTHVSGALEVDDEPPTDATPPTLQVTLTPSMLWPPNHKMVNVTASITVSDNADPNPAVRLVSITGNEPIAAGDIEGAAIGTDDRQFALRAERSGQQTEGRVYTVTYSATDDAGNSTTTQATVTVPHDRGH